MGFILAWLLLGAVEGLWRRRAEEEEGEEDQQQRDASSGSELLTVSRLLLLYEELLSHKDAVEIFLFQVSYADRACCSNLAVPFFLADRIARLHSAVLNAAAEISQ